MNNPNPVRIIFRILRSWILLVFVLTIACGLIYLVVQQNYRQNANDPQIQLAEDTATAIAAGSDPTQLVKVDRTDMANSLAPFLVIYDSQGKVIAGDGQLDGHIPVPPSGVFDYTRQNVEDKFTWQPRVGVRSATVVVYFSGNTSGYVLATRSLREVEKRTQDLGTAVLLVWFVGSLATLVMLTALDTAKVYLQKRGN